MALAKTKTKSSRKSAAGNTRKRAPRTPPPPPPPPSEVVGDPHVRKALEYCRAVVNGFLPACKQVRQACQRQLNDLARFKDHHLYFWDEAAAGRACRFIERLPHVKGPKAKKGELILLEGWQCFIVTTLFGWRRHDTQGRRFRRSYVEVPRGNAKSTLSSAIGLYCTSADGEEGAEVYSAATKREQAKIVQGDAQAMLRKRPDFAAKLGFVVNQHDIRHPRSNSKFEALSRESSTADGLNIHLAIVDELHAHKDRGMYDVIETGAGKRDSSLIFVITTAGTDTAGICYELRTFVLKVLDGTVEDESQFAIVYTLDPEDDWQDPKVWQKANPNWGVSVYPDAFEQLARKAMNVASAQNNFKTKHLNVWCNADVAAFDPAAWARCYDKAMKLSDFQGEDCVLGNDLATKTDIAARVKLFWKWFPKYVPKACSSHTFPGTLSCATCYPETGELEPHFYLFQDLYLPEAALHDGRNSQYEGWALEGWLQETPGDVLDFGVLKEDTIKDRDDFRVVEWSYDPWQSAQMAQELDQQGLTVVEVRMTVVNFSAPMKEFDALIRQARIHHDGSPAMAWMISNVVAHLDAKENWFPRKQSPENKIDGPVAAIQALGRAMLLVADGAGYSPTRGIRTL